MPYNVWNKDHYQCSDCRQLVEKDAGECPKCGRFTAPSGSSGQRSSGSSWMVGCLGLSFLLVLVCMICPKSDTAPDSSATSGSTSGGQYILNETGVLDPGLSNATLSASRKASTSASDSACPFSKSTW